MTFQNTVPLRRITGRALAVTSIALLFANVIACGKSGSDGPDVRGNGLRAAGMDDRARALVYDAALRQAFDVDSTLVLLVDPAILPRNGSFARDAELSPDAVAGVQRAGMTRGTCETLRSSNQAVPRMSC